jgi:hypothetical protein
MPEWSALAEEHSASPFGGVPMMIQKSFRSPGKRFDEPSDEKRPLRMHTKGRGTIGS